jgi:hypothetical protein
MRGVTAEGKRRSSPGTVSRNAGGLPLSGFLWYRQTQYLEHHYGET